MRHIETMKGTGTVTSKSGEKSPVQYELNVYQDQLHVGTLQDPHATIPGMKNIHGRVRPVRYFGDNDLLLEMEDGRKMKFFFRDMSGTIALASWIG